MTKNEIIKLSKLDLINLLNLYINNKATEKEVEDWANNIEWNDNIEYKSINDELLNEFICELANPILEWKINNIRAKKIIDIVMKEC